MERTRVGLHCDDDHGPMTRQALAVIMIAGPWAEKRYCDYSPAQCAERWGTHWSADFESCRRHLRWIDEWFHTVNAMPLHRIEELAHEYVEQHWDWIQKVAARSMSRVNWHRVNSSGCVISEWSLVCVRRPP